MRRAEIRHAVFNMLDEDVLLDKERFGNMMDRRRESRKNMHHAHTRNRKMRRKEMKSRGLLES